MIPDEAVEAARRELAKGAYQMAPGELPYADAARRALEAAAPHMIPSRDRLADILKSTDLPAGESYAAADALIAEWFK